MEPASKQFRKRNAILDHLRMSTAHPSAEELHRILSAECSDISLATVYRNLALFKEQGLIISLGTVNGIERFDGRTDPHIHFACASCGCVEDVPNLTLPESLTQGAAASLSCRVEDARLMLYGVCRACLAGKTGGC